MFNSLEAGSTRLSHYSKSAVLLHFDMTPDSFDTLIQHTKFSDYYPEATRQWEARKVADLQAVENEFGEEAGRAKDRVSNDPEELRLIHEASVQHVWHTISSSLP